MTLSLSIFCQFLVLVIYFSLIINGEFFSCQHQTYLDILDLFRKILLWGLKKHIYFLTETGLGGCLFNPELTFFSSISLDAVNTTFNINSDIASIFEEKSSLLHVTQWYEFLPTNLSWTTVLLRTKLACEEIYGGPGQHPHVYCCESSVSTPCSHRREGQ